MEDGGFHTVKSNSYHPNDFGLYCMSGNVAEWCRTAFDESVYEYGHDMNTEYIYHALDHDPPSMKKKLLGVVLGKILVTVFRQVQDLMSIKTRLSLTLDSEV